MSEENNQEVTTNPLDALQEKINQYETRIKEQAEAFDKKFSEVRRIQNNVWEFFNERFDGGEHEVTIHRDEANEILADIGAQELQQEFEGTVVVSFSFTVKASNEDEARQIVEDAVSGLENQIDAGADDSYSQDDIEVNL